MNLSIIRDPLYLKHSGGTGHPERPERLQAIDALLETFPLRDRIEDVAARPASFEELARVHEEGYIRRIAGTQGHELTMLDPDTGATAESYAAALQAAGGTIEAVRSVLEGGHSAFAFVRPPGHHAEAGRAMGFCLFNNVAVAACQALEVHGLERVLILDWDIHHGNGTMHSFYDSKQVLYFSVHQYPHYPGTGGIGDIGVEEGQGYTVNVPLPGGQGDAEYLRIFQRVFLPIAREYRPDLILVSAGFDAHRDDPLANMNLSSSCFGAMTALLRGLAGECCRAGLVLVLEGGYSLKALSEGVSEVLGALLDNAPVEEANLDNHGAETVDPACSRVIDQVLAVQRPFWKSI